MTISLPVDEQRRLAELHRYRLDEPGSVAPFDNLAKAAASAFGVPIALLSIITAEEQLFKGACGLDVPGTPRDQAFCAFAIGGDDIFMVEDALLDERFRDNPLVTGAPHIRFYAGAPLKLSAGTALGTLCLIDRQPRSLDAGERELLRMMGDTAVDLIRLRLGSLVAEDRLARLQQQSEALEKATQRQRAIFESAMDGRVTFDGRGVIDDANPAAGSIFGCAADELVGQNIGRYLAMPASLLDGSAATGVAMAQELVASRVDGTQFHADVSLSAFSPEGAPQYAAAIRDISERKQVERMKTEFVATVSHELRTPLTSIAGSLGLIAGGAAGEIAPKARKLIDIAHSNSHRLIRLINDLLDIEKIESGSVAFDLKMLDLREIAQEAIQANEGFAAAAGVRIALEPFEGRAAVRTDHDRLIQVLTNLLSNAIKFSPPSGQVDLRVTPGSETHRLTVTDNGPGIAPAFQPRLFDKFAQAETSDARSKGGTGLGLAIVHEIVRQMNGRVTFETSPQGTAFHVDLPAAPVARERVLLVHVEDHLSQPITDLLQARGITPVHVRDLAALDAACDGEGCAIVLLARAVQDADAPGLVRLIRAATTGDAPDHVSQAVAVVDWLDQAPSLADLRRGTDMLLRRRRRTEGKVRVLHVEDDQDVLGIVASALEGSADVIAARSIAEAREMLGEVDPDLVILDLALPDANGLSLLPMLRDAGGKPIPVVIYTASDEDPQLARSVSAMLTKSRHDLDDLVAAVLAAVEPQDDRS